ncbi:hypothetical protein ACSS6W_010662 [Trichoderma asperelloides]
MQFIQPHLLRTTRTDTPCRWNIEVYQKAPGPRDSGTPDARRQGQQDKALSKS